MQSKFYNYRENQLLLTRLKFFCPLNSLINCLISLIQLEETIFITINNLSYYEFPLGVVSSLDCDNPRISMIYFDIYLTLMEGQSWLGVINYSTLSTHWN